MEINPQDILTQSDAKAFAPSIINDLDSYVQAFARKAYKGHQIDSLVLNSFKAMATEQISNALETFYIKKKHWKNRVSFKPYAIAALRNFSSTLRKSINAQDTIFVLICPLCKELNNEKEVLVKEKPFWRCNICTSNFENEKAQNHHQSKLFQIFSLHSRKGYGCPDCDRFIPESSCASNGQISCPYLDCFFSGKFSELFPANHPQMAKIRWHTMLDQNVMKDFAAGNEKSLVEILSSNEIYQNPDTNLIVLQDINEKEKAIYSVIKSQINKIKKNENLTSLQKCTMYAAFVEILKEFPDEMIGYLANQQRTSFPIQARIFQKYTDFLEKELPFQLKSMKGITTEILDLLDPELGLFTGISKFSATIQNGKIPNLTKEEYVGKHTYKNYGPCYFGRLIDILNNGKSLKSLVKNYSFSEINLIDSSCDGTIVEVVHFRIPSHYEVGHLTFLQHIKKTITARVNFKLTNKK